MLMAGDNKRAAGTASVRLATTDDYDRYFVAAEWKSDVVDKQQALEESFFLGLRLNRGVDLENLREEFGDESKKYDEAIAELEADGLLLRSKNNLQLTARGRLLSNEVFEKFVADQETVSSGRS
jgi:oxygen-independent coproporphyrinogen III oxidase